MPTASGRDKMTVEKFTNGTWIGFSTRYGEIS